ncbi:cytochrome P450 [Lentinula raphanica]|uniref:Cytochrome P450 n=1 Tax=Lentinula raphanica TaxID=153919 RepID=A0AA38P7V0_9AGAR|nr:cytochrome P450 [Lentinula raphanica]KAJ3778596.1 cytochrome P450 [Lentinula raphanica]KAJ3824069.1 cytochrome P450 [Lentinula raphanica]KAJ3837920.1 cytochrome P450 [Lentinula raphanica]KAJ3974718.1 cytochrome P450 [Lentinula raphanica]
MLNLWVLLAAAVGYVALKVFGSQRKSYPPGPSPKPIVGNEVPNSEIWAVMGRWAKKYGDVLHFRIFSRHFVVLSSLETTLDLYEKRSKTYAGRPTSAMSELVRNGSVLFSQPGNRLEIYRRLLRAWLNPDIAKKHFHIQREETNNFLKRVVGSKDTMSIMARRYAGSIAIRLAYGDIPADKKEEFAQIADELLVIQNQGGQPSRWLVNSFPILRFVPAWFPGAHFKRWASETHMKTNELIKTPIQMIRQQMSTGEAVPSFATHFLENTEGLIPHRSDRDDIVACAANSFYAAGTETTSGFVALCFLLLSLHPEIQRKGQAEIDAVVGTEALPSIEHRSELPYIESILKEVHRFHPAAPLLFHATTKDDNYKGYFIPKGCTVYANIWLMLRDPAHYAEPEVFNPDRFMVESPPPDPRKLTFGLGRRNCPGQHVGDVSLWLTLARTIATCNIKSCTMVDGKPIDALHIPFMQGLASAPEPFYCDVEYRSQAYREMLDH